MARIGGRNNWLAVPAAMLCAGVVGVLVFLALPMFPVAVTWAGDTLRRASAGQPIAPAPPTPAEAAVDGMIDCRDLYPDALWSELTWTGGVQLAQTTAPPATSVASLTVALAPTPRVTCTWRVAHGRAIVTTLSLVAADAADIADPILRRRGFTCTTGDGTLRCQRVRGDVIEEHTVQGDLWLSSVETRWHPEGYGARVAAHVWG